MSTQEVTELSKQTNFSQKELKRIYKGFKKLDTYNKGYVNIHDLATIPEVDKNPLGDRICDVLSEKGTNHIDFKEFVRSLAVFNERVAEPSPMEEKIRFLFRVYDIDGDGFVNKDELFIILKGLVKDSLSGSQLQQIVDKTMKDLDQDKDGKLCFDEFKMAFKDQLNSGL